MSIFQCISVLLHEAITGFPCCAKRREIVCSVSKLMLMSSFQIYRGSHIGTYAGIRRWHTSCPGWRAHLH